MRLFIISALVLLSAPGFAQLLTCNFDTVHLGISEKIDLNVVYVENHKDEAVEMAIRFEPICREDGDSTAIQLCYGELCWEPVDTPITYGTTSVPVLVIPAGRAESTFKFTPFFYSSYSSAYKITFFDRNSPDDFCELIIDIDECLGTVSADYIDNVNLSISNAFPVPARDQVTIDCASRYYNPELRIINAFGQVMEKIQVRQEDRVQVDVSGYVSGTYFYVLFAEGVQSSPKRFVVAR